MAAYIDPLNGPLGLSEQDVANQNQWDGDVTHPFVGGVMNQGLNGIGGRATYYNQMYDGTHNYDVDSQDTVNKLIAKYGGTSSLGDNGSYNWKLGGNADQQAGIVRQLGLTSDPNFMDKYGMTLSLMLGGLGIASGMGAFGNIGGMGAGAGTDAGAAAGANLGSGVSLSGSGLGASGSIGANGTLLGGGGLGLTSSGVSAGGLGSLGSGFFGAEGLTGLGAAGAAGGLAASGLGSGGGGVDALTQSAVGNGAAAGASSLTGNSTADSLLAKGGATAAASLLGGGNGSGTSSGTGNGSGTNTSNGLSNLFGNGSNGSNGTNGSGFNTNGLGGLLGTLYDSYSRNNISGAMQDTMDKLENMYKPGTPEADLMEKQLNARDAAAGRRSQYGPRATELAGMLASKRMSALESPAYQTYLTAMLRNNPSSGGLGQLFGSLSSGLGGGNFLSNLFGQGSNQNAGTTGAGSAGMNGLTRGDLGNYANLAQSGQMDAGQAKYLKDNWDNFASADQAAGMNLGYGGGTTYEDWMKKNTPTDWYQNLTTTDAANGLDTSGYDMDFGI